MTVTLCTETAFNGDKKRFAGAVDNLAKRQFYGPVKSIVIDSHRPWVFCADFDFKGKAILLEPGEYNDISTMCPFKIKSLCELIDSDEEKSGRLEICVEDAEMVISQSCPEFVFQKKPKPSDSASDAQAPQDYKVKARLEVTGGTWILYSDQNYGGDLAVVTTSKAGRRMSFGQLATVRSAKKLSFLD